MGTQAAREPAEALKWLFTLIPAAPPARSRTSQLHFSRRPGVSLLGTTFWGKNPALLTSGEGWSSSFQESSNLSSETLPQKNQVPHMLLFSKKKLDGKPGKPETSPPKQSSSQAALSPSKEVGHGHSPTAQTHPKRAQKQSLPLISCILQRAWLVVSAELGLNSRTVPVNQYHISKPRRRSGGRGCAIAWKTHRRSKRNPAGCLLDLIVIINIRR